MRKLFIAIALFFFKIVNQPFAVNGTSGNDIGRGFIYRNVIAVEEKGWPKYQVERHFKIGNYFVPVFQKTS